MKNVIVGLGEALWDCLPDGKKLGGAPANFAYHTGQFGLNTLAVSALGEDTLGTETLEELKNKGMTILWVHHNLKQVIEMADTVTCIKKEIQFSGNPKKILDEEKILTAFS